MPATVVMIPVVRSTLRTRWLLLSAMYRLPSGAISTPFGYRSRAEVANPPSPPKPLDPVPATVVTMPVAASMRRIRWLGGSAMYTLPGRSEAMPWGSLNREAVAGPPSPP